MLTFELPFPPSFNHYYRHIGHATLISRKGREYRTTVQALVANLKPPCLQGPLEMFMEFFPPDRRRRDGDNLQKAIWDSLQHAGVYRDDSQIKHAEIWIRDPLRGGKAIVRLQELSESPP